MTGNRGWLRARLRCSSSPLIPGMRTSVMTQSVLSRAGDAANSSADSNTLTACPTDRSKLDIDSRTHASSSTTVMREAAMTRGRIKGPRASDVDYTLV